uniref:Uncharacterized protein n=1 Tax=Erpetoichthys calabaricus TaxID=27687 RepID=A0A8C4SVE8_ERPCA
MAEAQLCGLQDEFTCSLCLDTLTDPVTILCGHSFCLKCLTDCWDQSQKYSCPHCRHTFTTRPELNRNTLLNIVIKKLKKMTISSPPQNYACHGNVECDFCAGKKFRAVKSCLTYPASYCQTHLQPHYEGDALKHHKLMSVVREVEENEKSFTALMRCIEEAHRKLTERIREQEKREMEKAEEVMEQLEKEIEELKRREAELKELSETKDHLHFLQVRVTLHREFKSFSISLQLRPHSPVSSLTSHLSHVLFSRTPHNSPDVDCVSEIPVTHSQISSLVFFSLLSDFCPLTLDINTAHRWLRLSERNKKVTRERTEAKYPNHPDRFDCYAQVLCREAQTGIRCYWEVECSGHFMTIGVACKGLRRKGGSVECILGNNDKSWCLLWSHSKYSVCHNNQETEIRAPYSPRIGVYLDWPAGSLSFYSVSHTMTLLHRFKTSFTEPLYPGFCLYLKSSVTICHLTACDH